VEGIPPSFFKRTGQQWPVATGSVKSSGWAPSPWQFRNFSIPFSHFHYFFKGEEGIVGQTTITTIIKKRVRISGGSKKGRQHAVHETKYRRQALRTAKNKGKAWVNHLANNPHDLQAKVQIHKAKSL